MKIKKFTAASTQKALQDVKDELGSDSIILHVEEKNTPDSKKKVVEVTAAVDEEFDREIKLWNTNSMSRKKDTNYPQTKLDKLLGNPYQNSTSKDQFMPQQFIQPQQQRSPYPPPSFSELEDVREQLKSLTLLMHNMEKPELPPSFMDVYAYLINVGIERPLAERLLKGAEKKMSKNAQKSRQFIRKETFRSLESFISTIYSNYQNTEKKSPKIKVLVGATGVGKTTCIAKLSAIDKIYNNLNVGLISIDTYRIAAIEQLRIYANITKIPLYIAYSPLEMKTAISSMSDCDVIYVDTPGRSPKNKQALKEMSQFFQKQREIDFNLVLSLTCKMEDMNETLNMFSVFPIRHLLFTKLDETNSVGTMISMLNQAKKPISYISTGQNVPEDIVAPSPVSIAKMIMEGV